MTVLRQVKENPNISITPLATNAREFRDLLILGISGFSGYETRDTAHVFVAKDKACRWGQALGRLFYVGDGD